MTIERYRNPFLLYVLSILIPWILWFIAAYLSHIEPISNVYVVVASILGIIGLSSPMVIAFILIFSDPDLRNDLSNRFINLGFVKSYC
ncbi:hypothetical protein HPT25_16610 [Bacillus sp. BRMEA1]|uniref:hypothetical protein n=1 Tax=Neobacillus endophyticus TaxID=2738405 RepID=UPI0015654C87|nr:hypothetical protein [Neobacillus endophyticus]NRD78988.1 hypothetical protein [Neobacillus endophyticus]